MVARAVELKVEASGKGLVGHAGAALLHPAADRVGLTAGPEGACLQPEDVRPREHAGRIDLWDRAGGQEHSK